MTEAPASTARSTADAKSLLKTVVYGNTSVSWGCQVFAVRPASLRKRTPLPWSVNQAIHQRVGLRFYLRGLTEADTAAYVTHQCRRAGVDRVLFTPSALTLLAAQSRGLPRVINHLATAALWDAESQGAPVVEEAHVQHAVRDWRDDG